MPNTPAQIGQGGFGAVYDVLRHLEEALRLGFRNRDGLLKNPELASLRPLPAFKGLMATYFGGTAP